MKLSIIIPFHNAGQSLEACLKSVAQALPESSEVILVDDASTDDSLIIAKNFFFQIIQFAEQQGPAVARNTGTKISKGDILLFVDADVLVRPQTFQKILEAFEKRPEVSGVSAIYASEPAQNGIFQQFKTLEETYKYQAYCSDCYSSFDPHCGAVKRKAFISVGGFDPRYRGADVEDADFGYRLSKDHQNSIDASIEVEHIYGNFFTCSWNYLRRSFMWMRLFLGKFQFDEAVTTGHNAVSVILSTFVVLSLFIDSWIPLTTLGLVSIFWNRDFFRFGFQKLGARFAQQLPAHIFFFISLQFAIGLGAFFGLLYWPLRKSHHDKLALKNHRPDADFVWVQRGKPLCYNN